VSTNDIEKNEAVYTSTDPYPETWYNYRVGVGLNENMERVTHVSVHTYPARYIPASDKLLVAESADIKVTYEPATVTFSSVEDEKDLVIIAPKKFSNILSKLKDHKNSFGMKTFIKTTESIYDEYEGDDKPEKIKRFIDDAIQTNDITYVLLVGGLKSQIWNNPRDNMNYGDRWWHVPVRYTNFYDDPKYPLSFAKIYDPGFLCDQYYADVYGEGAVFQDWDSNGDGKIAVWGMDTKGFDIENDTDFDFLPDVAIGRLACRSKKEVRDVVNKIIKYEETAANPDWFKRVVTITGDGFMDQEDLDIQWDTSALPDGEYIIKAQSKNPNGEVGPVDKITVTIDRSVETVLTFNHDDWERIPGYPFSPIAEIVSVSDGDILGYDNFTYEPTEGQAYGNSQ
ncbi:MAG: peptidase C25, partial [Thermoplasmatales archaeon]|nr:peptidase C25 [Thermoplasmatales archaeon]